MAELSKDIQVKLQNAEILRALGVFLGGFGLIVLFAIFFTDTPQGKITNLIAGLILTLFGLGMILRGSLQIKTFKKN